MDIQLPRMDSLSATRRIKEEGALKEIPIVAANSYAMSGDERKPPIYLFPDDKNLIISKHSVTS